MWRGYLKSAAACCAARFATNLISASFSLVLLVSLLVRAMYFGFHCNNIIRDVEFGFSKCRPFKYHHKFTVDFLSRKLVVDLLSVSCVSCNFHFQFSFLKYRKTNYREFDARTLTLA